MDKMEQYSVEIKNYIDKHDFVGSVTVNQIKEYLINIYENIVCEKLGDKCNYYRYNPISKIWEFLFDNTYLITELKFNQIKIFENIQIKCCKAEFCLNPRKLTVDDLKGKYFGLVVFINDRLQRIIQVIETDKKPYLYPVLNGNINVYNGQLIERQKTDYITFVYGLTYKGLKSDTKILDDFFLKVADNKYNADTIQRIYGIYKTYFTGSCFFPPNKEFFYKESLESKDEYDIINIHGNRYNCEKVRNLFSTFNNFAITTNRYLKNHHRCYNMSDFDTETNSLLVEICMNNLNKQKNSLSTTLFLYSEKQFVSNKYKVLNIKLSDKIYPEEISLQQNAVECLLEWLIMGSVKYFNNYDKTYYNDMIALLKYGNDKETLTKSEIKDLLKLVDIQFINVCDEYPIVDILFEHGCHTINRNGNGEWFIKKDELKLN